MSYRNDHDAALARIESLERENIQLRDEMAALRNPVAPASHDEDEPPATTTAVPRGIAVVVAGMLIALVALIATTIRDSDPSVDRGGDAQVTMPDAPGGGSPTGGSR